MSSGTDAWEQALGARSGPSPRPGELPRATEASRHRASVEHRRPAKPKPEKRRDIQGLRMIAVVAVVINHLTGHPKGGFVGVDVFFVISGFLITGILVRDLDKGTTRGRYILNFYLRRIRRILPAALIVLLLGVIAANSAFSSARFSTTWHDALWATVFWANWHFVDIGTNYFTAGLPESPFQHYWSLSVEEQFYFAWPVILLTIAIIVGRKRSAAHRRIVAAVAAGAVTLVSLVYAYHQSSADPTTAYFSTFSRGWELGLGAMLACALPYFSAKTAVLTAMSWLGMAAIGVSFFVTLGGSGFPAPGALLPCLGSALVLAAYSGKTGATAKNLVLTNAVSGFVGDISYSVYLVHFPVIILMDTYITTRGSYYYSACLFLTLGSASALYGLVERPILNSEWLQPKAAMRDRAAAADDPISSRSFALGASLCIVLALAAVALWPGNEANIDRKFAQINASSNAVSGSAAPTAVALPPRAAALQKSIKAALAAQSYPRLSPSMDKAISGPQASARFEQCAAIKLSSSDICTFGPSSAPHVVYVVGDSTAMVYAQPLTKVVEKQPGWKLRFVAAAGCRFTSTVVAAADAKIAQHCAAHNAAVVSEIRRVRPDLVVLTDTYNLGVRLDGSTIDLSDLRSYLTEEVSKIQAFVKKTIFISPPPDSLLPDCYKPGGVPTECVGSVSSLWFQIRDVEKSLAIKIRGTYVDSELWFCSPSGYCPAFVGTTPTRRDTYHASIPYAESLAPVMGEALQRSGAFS